MEEWVIGLETAINLKEEERRGEICLEKEVKEEVNQELLKVDLKEHVEDADDGA